MWNFKPLKSEPFNAMEGDVEAPEFDDIGDDLIEALGTPSVNITPITDATGYVDLSTFTDEDFLREHPVQVNSSKFMARLVLQRTHYYRAEPSDLWRLEWSWFANNTHYRLGVKTSFVVGTVGTLAKYLDFDPQNFDPKAREYTMTAKFFAWAKDYPMAVEDIDPGMTNRITTWDTFPYDVIGRIPPGVEGPESHSLPGMNDDQARACFQIHKALKPARTRNGKEFVYSIARAFPNPMVLLK
jgi:hypothetical protein